MLHKETVEKETYELLTALMQDEQLKGFNLAGGTALALHIGHRLSIDLDLFTVDSFNASKLEEYLTRKYNFVSDFIERNTLKGRIKDVKVDCITYDYPLINEIVKEDSVRLYSMQDIAAMKLSVITDNGTRLKDFIDIAYLSTKFSLSDMIEAYKIKYPSSNYISPLKSLSYYDDINFNEPIQMLKGTYEWSKIDKRIESMLITPDKTFVELP